VAADYTTSTILHSCAYRKRRSRATSDIYYVHRKHVNPETVCSLVRCHPILLPLIHVALGFSLFTNHHRSSSLRLPSRFPRPSRTRTYLQPVVCPRPREHSSAQIPRCVRPPCIQCRRLPPRGYPARHVRTADADHRPHQGRTPREFLRRHDRRRSRRFWRPIQPSASTVALGPHYSCAGGRGPRSEARHGQVHSVHGGSTVLHAGRESHVSSMGRRPD
jgi:hypothetical protein